MSLFDKLLRWLGLRRYKALDRRYRELVEREWAKALKVLKALGIDEGELDSVAWHEFSWHPQDDVFMCGDGLAHGCFKTRGREIHWNTHYPHVLRHEIAHGLAYLLGYDLWREVGH